MKDTICGGIPENDGVKKMDALWQISNKSQTGILINIVTPLSMISTAMFMGILLSDRSCFQT